jgi:hypothetical protein
MGTYNDGSVPYGFPGLVGIDTTGTNAELPNEFYVLEDIQVTETSTVIERRDGQNVMSGRVVIDDNPSGTGREFASATMRLQRATLTQPFPPIGSLFRMLEGAGSLEIISAVENGRVWAVASGGQNYNQATAHTFEVQVFPTGNVV